MTWDSLVIKKKKRYPFQMYLLRSKRRGEVYYEGQEQANLIYDARVRIMAIFRMYSQGGTREPLRCWEHEHSIS